MKSILRTCLSVWTNQSKDIRAYDVMTPTGMIPYRFIEQVYGPAKNEKH